jgi:hypothetical protein
MDKPKLYMVGDCHIIRAFEYGRFTEIAEKVDAIVWGRAGLSCWHLDIGFLQEQHHLSNPLEYAQDGADFAIDYNAIKDEGKIIMPWIGYVDIRQYLVKYKDADYIVKKYVDDFVKHYPNSIIQFIEPLPQFTKMWMKYEGFNIDYSYEERQEQNHIFIKELRDYCQELNLPEPISQKEIYEAIGKNILTEDVVQQKNRPHPVDALQDHYYAQIYELFVQKGIELYNKLEQRK